MQTLQGKDQDTLQAPKKISFRDVNRQGHVCTRVHDAV